MTCFLKLTDNCRDSMNLETPHNDRILGLQITINKDRAQAERKSCVQCALRKQLRPCPHSAIQISAALTNFCLKNIHRSNYSLTSPTPRFAAIRNSVLGRSAAGSDTFPFLCSRHHVQHGSACDRRNDEIICVRPSQAPAVACAFRARDHVAQEQSDGKF